MEEEEEEENGRGVEVGGGLKRKGKTSNGEAEKGRQEEPGNRRKVERKDGRGRKFAQGK